MSSTLIFGADGAVNGNGGCNTFRGDVDIEGTTMKFGPSGVDNDGPKAPSPSRGPLPRSTFADGVVRSGMEN